MNDDVEKVTEAGREGPPSSLIPHSFDKLMTGTPSFSENAPADFPPDPHLMDYVLLMAKHKWIVISVTFISGIIALGLTYIVPNIYDAVSMLLPPDRVSSSGLLSALNAGGALKILKEVENPSVDLIQNYLESDSLMERLLHDARIRHHFGANEVDHHETIANLKQAITVTPWFAKVSVGGSVATGWFPTDSAKEEARGLAAYLANKAVRTLDTMMLEDLRVGTHLSRIYSDSDYATRYRELDSLDGLQEQFEKANGIPLLKQQTLQTIQKIGELEANRDEARIRANLLSMDYAGDDPKLRLAQANVEETQAALMDFERDNPIGPSLEELPAVTRGYAEILRQKAALEPIVTYLRQEREQQRITEEREKSLLTILDVAKDPESRSSPKRMPILILGLFGGAFISIVWIGLISLISSWKRISREAESPGSSTSGLLKA
jgi:tyrosine-protein kinase Etk/Wzc